MCERTCRGISGVTCMVSFLTSAIASFSPCSLSLNSVSHLVSTWSTVEETPDGGLGAIRGGEEGRRGETLAAIVTAGDTNGRESLFRGEKKGGPDEASAIYSTTTYAYVRHCRHLTHVVAKELTNTALSTTVTATATAITTTARATPTLLSAAENRCVVDCKSKDTVSIVPAAFLNGSEQQKTDHTVRCRHTRTRPPHPRHNPPLRLKNSHVVLEIFSKLSGADVATETLWNAVEPFLDIAEVSGHLREQKQTEIWFDGVISRSKEGRDHPVGFRAIGAPSATTQVASGWDCDRSPKTYQQESVLSYVASEVCM